MKQSSKSKTIKELAEEYENQSYILRREIDKIKRDLPNLHGQDLYLARKKIKIYDDMAIECLLTAKSLKDYNKTPP